MRTMGLSILLASLLVPISRAQEPAQPEKHYQAAFQNLLPDAESAAYMQLRRYDRESLPDGDSYCAFMRTYRVRREQRGSDAVRPAGYRTCVPTRRFELRSTVQIQPERSSPPQIP
jgi:hypothetical protein